MRTFWAFIILLLILTAACGVNNPSRKPRPETGKIEAPVQINSELAEKVKEMAKTVQGVEDCTAVVIDNNISAAVKVKGFNRLRLKSIKGKVYQKVKESSKDYEVHVTSDKKIFSQIQQLEKEIREQKVQSPANIKKKIEKINKSMQG
ncbi:MAG: YhcN/YlaJ family sporulation lipoprotein [Bacillota bacterium]